MSRTITPQTAQPAMPSVKIPHEKIAMRAYDKWVKRGCEHGHHHEDWMEAEAELRAEYARTASLSPRR